MHIFAITLIQSDDVSISANVLPPDSNNNSGNTGGGGGGGGGSYSGTQVIFRGSAYPDSTVSLLKDGQIVARIPASPDATFDISLSGISAGTYVFGVVSEDTNGVRSTMQTFTLTITNGVTTLIRGIFIPPTISLDKSQVKRGDIITFFGQSIPNAQVNLFVHSNQQITQRVSADNSGSWVYKFDTLGLEYGDHLANARATKDADISRFSPDVTFKVGTSTSFFTGLPLKYSLADINKDTRVNAIDFSIMAYWYKRPLTTAGKKSDLNNDGKVDLIDFSILAYYWTG